MATIGVKVELEGQKEYTQGMKQLKEETKLFDAQLKNLDSTMKGQSAFSKSMKEHELLQGKMEALTKQSELLENRIKQASETYGENDSRTLALRTQYEKLQGEIAKTNQALQENNGFFTAFTAQLDDIGSKLENTGEKISAVGDNLSKNLTAPIVALGAASVAAFKEVDSGMDTIVEKTGASGEALEEMKGIAENLAKTIPTSFDAAGEAIGEVNTRFGLTGDSLEELSGQFIKFAELNNTDISNSIDTVQKALSAYGLGADDAASYLDRLNYVGQQTGVSVDSISSGIISNATAFQEMGLSIDEAVTFMGQLEKSGANSETVLNGMRKALKNAAAEGKPLSTALEELQDIIENGTDGMDGLTAAYELFGKSGDQIYGAVKSGTVNFKKLVGTIEDAGDSINKTFDATIDPIDRFQTTLNKVKLSGSRLIEASGPLINQFFDKVTVAIDKLTEKWESLSLDEQEQIVKIGLVVAAAGPLISVIGRTISAVGSLTTSASTLVGFIVANPVLAGITVALGLCTVALIETKREADNLYHSIADLTEEEKAAKSAAEEFNQQMDNLVSNNKAVVDSIDAQYGAEQRLLSELKSIVDENGKVKSGYEDRAEVITNQLSEAFGIEIEMQDGVIQKYGEVMSAIDEVILKKKAEALLSSGLQDYTNALQGQKEAYENLKTAQDSHQKALDDQAAAQERLTEAQTKFDEALAMGLITGMDPYTTALANAGAEAQAYNDKVANTTEVLNACEQAFYNGQATITNYEALQTSLTGSTEEMDAAVTAFTNNLMNEAPVEFLKQQAEDATKYYEELLADFNSGETAISEAQLENAKANAEAAQKILEEAGVEFESQGLAASQGYANGLVANLESIRDAGRQVADAALAAVAAAQETGSPAKKYIEQGAYGGQGYVDGLLSKEQAIIEAMTRITELLRTSEEQQNQIIADGLMKNKLSIDSGMSQIITGLELNFDQIKIDNQQLNKTLSDETDSTFGNIEDTISTKMGEVVDNVASNCSTIESNFSHLTDNSYSWGSDFIGNFESGIISRMQSVLSRVRNLASQIASYMHFSVPDKGPLADADEWMPDFMRLLAEGIDSNRYLVDNAVKGLSVDMADMLSNPIDSDEMYDAIRRGASDATTRIILNGRDLTRGLKDLGVVFND